MESPVLVRMVKVVMAVLSMEVEQAEAATEEEAGVTDRPEPAAEAG